MQTLSAWEYDVACLVAAGLSYREIVDEVVQVGSRVLVEHAHGLASGRRGPGGGSRGSPTHGGEHRLLVGLLVAAVLGLGVGLAVGLVPVFDGATGPMFQFLRMICRGRRWRSGCSASCSIRLPAGCFAAGSAVPARNCRIAGTPRIVRTNGPGRSQCAQMHVHVLPTAAFGPTMISAHVTRVRVWLVAQRGTSHR
jgi:hypothetical protein